MPETKIALTEEAQLLDEVFGHESRLRFTVPEILGSLASKAVSAGKKHSQLSKSDRKRLEPMASTLAYEFALGELKAAINPKMHGVIARIALEEVNAMTGEIPFHAPAMRLAIARQFTHELFDEVVDPDDHDELFDIGSKVLEWNGDRLEHQKAIENCETFEVLLKIIEHRWAEIMSAFENQRSETAEYLKNTAEKADEKLFHQYSGVPANIITKMAKAGDVEGAYVYIDNHVNDKDARGALIIVIDNIIYDLAVQAVTERKTDRLRELLSYIDDQSIERFIKEALNAVAMGVAISMAEKDLSKAQRFIKEFASDAAALEDMTIVNDYYTVKRIMQNISSVTAVNYVLDFMTPRSPQRAKALELLGI